MRPWTCQLSWGTSSTHKTSRFRICKDGWKGDRDAKYSFDQTFLIQAWCRESRILSTSNKFAKRGQPSSSWWCLTRDLMIFWPPSSDYLFISNKHFAHFVLTYTLLNFWSKPLALYWSLHYFVYTQTFSFCQQICPEIRHPTCFHVILFIGFIYLEAISLAYCVFVIYFFKKFYWIKSQIKVFLMLVLMDSKYLTIWC